MTQPASITEAESVVMAALWRCGPLAPKALFAEVRKAQPWAEPTIKTLLGRLMQKGAVRSERRNGTLSYVPELTRHQYVETEVAALTARLFDGDLSAFRDYLDEATRRA